MSILLMIGWVAVIVVSFRVSIYILQRLDLL
jgi:hypothetical protein